MSTQRQNRKLDLTVRDICVIGLMIAMLEAGKQALLVLPNIEVISLFLILFSLSFGRRIWFVIPAFVLIEGCLYGFGIWWIMYLYTWPLLALFTFLLRKKESVWLYSILSGLFGLFFGALCAIPYLFIGGPSMAFTWWIAGIPYDIIHAVGNFTLCLCLFRPLRSILKRVNGFVFEN